MLLQTFNTEHCEASTQNNIIIQTALLEYINLEAASLILFIYFYWADGMLMHPGANNAPQNYTHTLNSYRSNNYPHNIQLDNTYHPNHFLHPSLHSNQLLLAILFPRAILEWSSLYDYYFQRVIQKALMLITC